VILVDTSAWIDFFRGRGPCCERVDQLLDDNDVALCGPVKTELVRGLHSTKNRQKVLPLLQGCHDLAQPAHLWHEAGELGAWLGRQGVNVKSLDLLIATYALQHSLEILTNDTDFLLMKRAGVRVSALQ